MPTLYGTAAVFFAFLAADAHGAAALQQIQTIPLEGVQGRIDHLAVDPAAKRLYVAALGNNTVEVIDLEAGTRVQSIHGLNEPQGIAVIPESGKVVVASGKDGKCRVYDRSLELLGAIDDLDDADNVRYDARTRRIYVGYGDGALAVIDPDKITKLADIKLPGHPESFQLETAGKRIFINVPSARQIVVVDRDERSVVAHWPRREAAANFPMALDEANHRLFVGCRKPAKLLVLDTSSGSMAASADCCGDTDDLFYDVANKRIYVSGGEGCISVFEPMDPDHYALMETIRTAAGARTSLFVPPMGKLYLAVPHRGAQGAEIRVFRVTGS